jgi:hypothetical protein
MLIDDACRKRSELEKREGGAETKGTNELSLK